MSSASSNYSKPVSQLLTYGDCRDLDFFEWPDYLELGLSGEQIPELIRMVTDEALYQSDAETLESWAPIHAWRTLAQLHACEAIEPLLTVLPKLDDLNDYYWEWISEELPMVFQRLGGETLPSLARYLSDVSKGQASRINVVETLQNLAEAYPEARPSCISILTEQLKQFEVNEEVNGFIAVALADLKAVESAPIIEEAFQRGCVEERIGGDWEDIQVLLGLKSQRERPRTLPSIFLEDAPLSLEEFNIQPKKAKSQAKKKRKMRKESRRKNRPKKK